jgi:iron complex transport system ATP-binding protein
MRRALTALALAQQPDILLLDEPTAFLDMAHQFELLDLLSSHRPRRVTWSSPCTTVADGITAARDRDERRRIVAAGPTDEVLTVEPASARFGGRWLQPHPCREAHRVPVARPKRRARTLRRVSSPH